MLIIAAPAAAGGTSQWRGSEARLRLSLRYRQRWLPIADLYAIGPRLVPGLERQSMSLDELPYGARALVEDPVERRHHDTEGVTEDAAARDARELPVVRDGYGEAVMVVDVQHDMDVRAAIADVDHTIRSNV